MAKALLVIGGVVSVGLVGALVISNLADDDTPSGPRFESLRDLAAAVNEAGWGCDDFEEDAAPDMSASTTGGCQIVDPDSEPETFRRTDGTVTCDAGSHLTPDGLCAQDANTEFHSFRDGHQQANWMRLAEEMGCPIIDELTGIPEVPVVTGDGWVFTVSEMDPEALGRLASALGANHVRIRC